MTLNSPSQPLVPHWIGGRTVVDSADLRHAGAEFTMPVMK